MIITQTFTMARWQIVVKKSEATKQTEDQNNNKTKKEKQNNTKHKNRKGEFYLTGFISQTF